MFFGERLKELRIARKLSQADVAAAIGVSRAAYTNWEAGLKVPSFENAIAVCRVLKVSTAEFEACRFGRPAAKR